MTWRQINAQPDSWRMANLGMIRQYAKQLGYTSFEDGSIAGPGTKAYAASQNGTFFSRQEPVQRMADSIGQSFSG